MTGHRTTGLKNRRIRSLEGRGATHLNKRTDPFARLVEAIAEAIAPDKIFLFGSRADGGARPDSDIDLLVLYSGPMTKREVRLRIHRLFAHPEYSLDVFVLAPEEFESRKHVANTLAREVSERGVACYG